MLLATLALIAVALPAPAQGDYPNRPITLVVPLPPGGTNDIMARTSPTRSRGARPAGGDRKPRRRRERHRRDPRGRPGTADGYTILLAYTSTMATGPSMYANVGYDVRKDFAPIGLIGCRQRCCCAPKRAGSQCCRPGRRHQSQELFQFGSPGVGTVNHLAAVLFASGRCQT